MKKRSLVCTLLVMSSLNAAGWKLPEQSAESTALSGANVANAMGADAAYYNPANMSFEKQRAFSFDVINVTLDAPKYKGTYTTVVGTPVPVDAEGEKENKLVPAIFYTSEPIDGVSYGFSVIVPGGLTKRWEDEAVSKVHAEKFSLEIVEFNPSLSYKLNDNLAIGGGLRVIKSSGEVKSSGSTEISSGVYSSISREMSGDGLSYGFNVALAYKPEKNMNISATYRSPVDMKIDGNAKLSSSAAFALVGGSPVVVSSATVGTYNGDTSITIPLPATSTLASSYDFGKTVVEVLYEITHWSKYKNLDFKYPSAIANPVLASAFDNPKLRDWSDTTAIRLGVTHQLNEKVTLMAGYATDESPSKADKVSFESPNADGILYSFGGTYKYEDNINLSAAYLKTVRETAKVSSIAASDTTSGLNGEFTNTDATLIAFGIEYLF